MSDSYTGAVPSLALTPSQVLASEAAQWYQIVRQSLADTRCATPAFLTEDLDAATQTVTVQIAIQERVRVTSKLPGTAWMDIPPIIKVPIILPRGGGYSLTLPLKKGDEGILIFCDTCFDLWWKYGQTNAPKASNAGSPSGTQKQLEIRRHYLHDCGFHPGMWSQPHVLSNYSTTSMQLRSDDGASVVDVSTAGIAVTAPSVTVKATSAVDIEAPETSVFNTGGTPLALVNSEWLTWYTTNVQPFLVSKGYTGPAMPSASQTTILKGE